MRKFASCGLVLLLAACGDPTSPAEQKLADDRLVAEVERANDAPPPIEQVTPDPILDADMERHDIAGPGCSYAPGTSLGARVIARETDAYMKIGGKITRFAADSGSQELPAGTRNLYVGRSYILRLSVLGPTEEPDTGEAKQSDRTAQGRILLRDAFGRTVYEGSGFVQCDG